MVVQHEVGPHGHPRGGQQAGGVRRGRQGPHHPHLPPVDPALDPAQTYILSGPFFHFDPAHGGGVVGVFTARPIPRGMTVIATPSRMPMATPMPMLANAAMAAARQQFNPNAAPFYPKQLQHHSMLPPPPALSPPPSPSPSSPPLLASPSSPGSDLSKAGSGSGSSAGSSAKRSSPCIMLFSSACPDGRLVPLRQPQPPVYFQQPSANGNANGQAEHDHPHDEPHDEPPVNGDRPQDSLGGSGRPDDQQQQRYLHQHPEYGQIGLDQAGCDPPGLAEPDHEE